MQFRFRLLWSTLLLVLTLHAKGGESHYHIVENQGQWPEHVVAAIEVSQGRLFLERNAFTWHFQNLDAVAAMHGTGQNPAELNDPFRIRGHVYRSTFVGANEEVRIRFSEAQKTRYNYFLGNDPAQWAGDVPAWGKITYVNIYPGIDLQLYSDDFVLKYDFIVHPGADPSPIRMRYEGAEEVQLSNRRVKITTSVNEVIEQAPIAWQLDRGQKIPVQCEYRLGGDELSFALPGGCNPDQTLVIDPVLLFSTYSGSTSDNFGFTATYDEEGYLYAGSSAFGNGYPTTLGAYQESWAGGDGQGSLAGTDIALTKYDVSGTFRVYSTYLGGANDELPHSLIVNPAGELIVMGTSSSPNFPTTADAFQTNFNGGSNVAPVGVGVQYVNGSDLVVTRFSANGSSLLSSTFLGGSGNDGVNTAAALKFNYADEFRGEVELDNDGNILIASCTYSTDFPTANAWQSTNAGGLDGCLTKFTPDLSSVLFSTYLGSVGQDGAYSIAVTSDNSLYLCGGTTSQSFPVTNGVLQNSYGGGSADGFVLKFTADGQSLEHSTYLGSDAYDQAYFIEVDGDDKPYIYGQTRASGSSFIINAGYGSPNSGMHVASLTPELDNFIWSTVFGTGSGKPNLSPTAFLVDVCGKIYLSGWGGSTNTSSNINTDNVFGMETTDDAFQSNTNGSDFYLLVLEDDASDLVYASYFGGMTSAEHVDGGTSRFNRKGQIYQSVCAGCGSNDDFPIFPSNAVSPTNNSSNCNNGVFKFDFLLPITIADFNVPLFDCLGGEATFTNTSTNGLDFFWDFGDGNTSTDPLPTHEYTEPGTYEVMLVASNPETCNAVDTLYKTVTILEAQSTALEDLSICEGESIGLGPLTIESDWSVFWSPAETLNDPTLPNPQASPPNETLYTALIDNGVCVDTVFQFVEITNLGLQVPENLVACNIGEEIILTASTDEENATWWWSSNADFTDQLNASSDDPSAEIILNEAGTYFVQLSIGDCTATDSVQVSLIADAIDLGADITVCAGDTVTISTQNALPGYDLTWSPSEFILSGQGTESVQVFASEDGFFTLTASNAECEVSADIFVSTSGLNFNQIEAIADPPSILSGESSTISASPAGYDYAWSPAQYLDDPNAASTLATPPQTTIFTLTLSDGECIFTDTVQVRVFDFTCGPPNIYVPNAFTPNSDDLNESLFVRGNFLTDVYFVIYNRWGEKVFETRSLSEGWDGTYKGRAVDPAVFVYYLEAVCEDGQEYFEKGNITLIR